MPKHTSSSISNFGKRFAQIRKAAGYTQQALADEIGVSRRVITYYETESENPPANLLVDLARALNVSTDQLLGLQPTESTKPGRKIERQLKQIETLSPKAKRQVSLLLETFIEAEQLKKDAGKH